MQKIYLDHSATTPVDKKVAEAMLPYFNKFYGNPSSIHTFGQEALAGVDKAREQVAAFLNCAPNEIIFTSGATESNNLAIKGLIKALKNSGVTKPHVITSLIEHDAVLEPCMELEKSGAEITHLSVGPNAVINLENFKKAIRDNTVLVSIMHVNSEVGSIQPIREIGKIIFNINEKRIRDWKKLRPKDRGAMPQKIYFHTDATQALNFCNSDVKWNYVDLLSLSGHKIYGPKGIGALYAKSSTPIEALTRGGHQENNLRSGTLNVPGIVGLGCSMELLGIPGKKGELSAVQKKNNKKIAGLRDMFVDLILKNIPGAILNTPRAHGTPSHAHFTFPGVEGESVLISLDLQGIAVSTGSACASNKLKASHVLLAMGIKKEIAHSSIRFTLGKYTTAEELKRVAKILPPIIERLRRMNPLYK
ncbi:MAG: cysteine desulfurase family protein [bacterium]